MKKGKRIKNPIIGGSKGLPALKKEKKKVIKKNTQKRKYSLRYII